MTKPINPVEAPQVDFTTLQKQKLAKALDYRSVHENEMKRLETEFNAGQEALREIQKKHAEAAKNVEGANTVISTLAQILQELGVDLSQPLFPPADAPVPEAEVLRSEGVDPGNEEVAPTPAKKPRPRPEAPNLDSISTSSDMAEGLR